MNIYGSIKHHLVRERTEVAIICDVDNDIRPHIIPLGESTLKRTDKPSCLRMAARLVNLLKNTALQQRVLHAELLKFRVTNHIRETEKLLLQ